jgi:CxxC motif-containing protein
MCSSNEFKDKEIFTSIIRIKSAKEHKVVPVRTNKEVPRELWIEISKVISRLYANIPIKVGEVICKNILNTGIDIISTKDIN